MTRLERRFVADKRKVFGDLPPLQGLVLLLATLIGVYLCFLLAAPLLAPLTWTLTVAVLAAPLHRRIERVFRHPSLAAALSATLLATLVIIPLILLGQQLLSEVVSGATALQKQLAGDGLQRLVDSHPLLTGAAAEVERRIDVGSIFTNLTETLTAFATSLVRGSLTQIITLLVTFYLLFFFLRDRRLILHQIKMLSPLSDAETDRLFVRVSDTIHAMMFGTVVTSAIQGALGGLMFWLLGLPNPLFWGVVMMMLAIIPVLGTFVIWLPVAAYLALTGEWGKAAILAAWGAVVISSIDNLLYPILAGGRLRMHTIPMFVAIVGGLLLFGAAGVILGPLAVALTIALLEIWRARIHAEVPPPAER